MKKHLLPLLFLCLNFSYAQNTQPKLVVGIVVDQMRQEYLYRFEYSIHSYRKYRVKYLKNSALFLNTRRNYTK